MPQMIDRRKPRISALKTPKQARANALIAAVLEAAVQVLKEEGAARFTTARVAERAGVSVGSLYQYFPNKAAILFRLQSDEWRATSALLRGILEDKTHAPIARLRRLVHAFIRSECEEAAIRAALHDAAPLYRDAPEAEAAKGESKQVFRAFMAEAVPDASEEDGERTTDIIKTTLSHVGAHFSATPRTDGEIIRYADALADMVCGYLERLNTQSPSIAQRSPARS